MYKCGLCRLPLASRLKGFSHEMNSPIETSKIDSPQHFCDPHVTPNHNKPVPRSNSQQLLPSSGLFDSKGTGRFPAHREGKMPITKSVPLVEESCTEHSKRPHSEPTKPSGLRYTAMTANSLSTAKECTADICCTTCHHSGLTTRSETCKQEALVLAAYPLAAYPLAASSEPVATW